MITHKKYTNKGRESYQHQLKPFVLVDNEIRYYEIDNRRNVFKARLVRRVPLTSEIKDLQLCFASKDKLLIEDKVIENICDFDTMTFVGSVVDVINPSGDWAEVEYNYYFKDKNGVYLYHTNKEKLQKLSYDPQNFSEENLYTILLNRK